MTFDLKKYEQSVIASDNSTAIQAGRDCTFNYGVSAPDVVKIFMELSQPLLQSCVEKARKMVEARLNEFMGNWLQELEKHHVTNFNFAKEPRYHFCLSDAQRAYAKSGDKDILAILSKMLAEMAKSDNNNIRDFVLEQSVQILQKLDSRLLNVLSLGFMFKETQYGGLMPNFTLSYYFNNDIQPICSSLTADSSVDYLTSCGCGSFSDTGMPLEHIITKNYGSFFTKGFTQADVEAQGLRMDCGIIEPIPDSPGQYCVPLSAMTLENLKLRLSPDDFQKLKALVKIGQYKPDKVKQILIGKLPFFKDLFQNWNTSRMRYFQLNAVGKTLAINWLKKTNPELAGLPLEDWVP